MAQSLTDLLKLSKAQMNKLGKTELVDILDAAREERGNNQDIHTDS